MQSPEMFRYTSEHEWIWVKDDEAIVGITVFAQESLGDIVYVELPEVGRRLKQQDIFGVVESVKTTSDLYAPASGEIIAVNDALKNIPQLINEDCYGKGWLVKLRLANPAELAGLHSAADYDYMIADHNK